MSDINIDGINPASDPNAQKKPISEAKLAANRANSQKSTGPRTEAGKLKAASNSLKHGLFSLKNFEKFVHDQDIANAVIQNLTESFDAVTPVEVLLLHQLVNQQLRFLQMEYLYGESMHFRVPQLLEEPKSILPAILRELDRLPVRIARTTKLLSQEIAARKAAMAEIANRENEANLETCIEQIPDLPPLPARPQSYSFYGLRTDRGDIEADKIPGLSQMFKTNPPSSTDEAKLLLRKFLDKIKEHAEANPPQPPQTTEQEQ